PDDTIADNADGHHAASGSGTVFERGPVYNAGSGFRTALDHGCGAATAKCGNDRFRHCRWRHRGDTEAAGTDTADDAIATCRAAIEVLDAAKHGREGPEAEVVQ